MINLLLDMELIKSVLIVIVVISVLVGVFGCLMFIVSMIVSNDHRDDLIKLGSYLLGGSMIIALLALVLAIISVFL